MVLSGALLAISLVTVSQSTPDRSGITWINDDWAKAKAKAAEAGQLVAVDVWATWCHTCLSMKSFVFTDEKLAKAAAQHTWLAIDFDRPENAAFVSKFAVGGLPTFLVVDPKTDTLVGRWVGSGTAEQMARFYEGADKASKDPLVLGHRALAREDYKGARKIFEAALAKASGDKTARTLLLGGYIEALWKLDPKTCAKVGLGHIQETDNTAPGIDFVAMVAMCAEELPEADKRKAFEAIRDRLAPLAGDASLPLSADDHSGLYGVLADTHRALGEEDAAAKMVAARVKHLEAAAQAAKTPAERATYDAHRLEVYLQLERFQDAEKMLLLSEAAQPEDFNHPWRLAVLYKKQGKVIEGLAAIDRALAKGYGGRRLRLYSTKVDLLIAKKSFDWARRTIAEAKAEVNAMPKGQVRPSWVKELESKLADIEKLEKAPS